MRESGEAYKSRSSNIRISHRVTITNRMTWGEHVAYVGERKGLCRVRVGKPEGKW